MNKIDKYIKETLLEILEEGQWDKEPRTKWSDGTVAHSKFITQKVFEYNISKGEYSLTTLRTTALRGAWEDINTIYLKQTNILEDMHPSIHSWWKDFCHNKWYDYFSNKELHHLGATYGNTVKRYNLVDKLLKGLYENPFGRRHKMNLWQEQQVTDDPKALEPCAGLTLWTVRDDESGDETQAKCYKTRYIDLTLIQRSSDFLTACAINQIQYVMLGMVVCNHLTFKTGIKHELGKFMHVVQNAHVYDKHFFVVEEMLDRKPTGKHPKVKLVCGPKDFYEHTFEDFEFEGLEGIQKLENKIEIAI